jgi:hypothetical protein
LSALLGILTSGGCARGGHGGVGGSSSGSSGASAAADRDGATNPIGIPGSVLADGAVAPASTALYFNPPSLNVTVGNTPQVASFTLMAKQAAGPDVAVVPETAVFSRPDIASMMVSNPVVLTASGQAAGDGTLQAVYGGQVASAKLHVSVHLSTTGAGVDANAPPALDAATAPDPMVTALLYPYDKTVFPLGVTSPLVMWNPPSGTNPSDAYRLRFEEQDFVCDDYQIVAAPGSMRIAQTCWDWLTSSNQGDPVKVTLSRWDGAKRTASVSARETWPVAHANMQGAVYYWSTAGASDGHLSRIHSGTGALPEVLFNGTCMACHAVSADGSTLVAVVGDIMMPGLPGENTTGSPPSPCNGTGTICQENDLTDDRAWLSFDLPGVTVRHQSNMFGGNVAVTPDGKYTVFGDLTLYLADTTNGQLFATTGLDSLALETGMQGLMMPTFSPDGKHLAAVEGLADPSGPPSFITLAGGKLIELDFNETARTFSNPVNLAPANAFPPGQQAIAYPTFSPDSQWLAFHVGDKPTGCEDTCDANETEIGAIYLQNTSGAAPIRMTSLVDSSPNPSDHNVTLEPTFNPVARGGYFWVVVSSERNWGNRITGTPNNGKKRLWVAAIDQTPGGSDSSHPAFFLEGQEENRENMRGFWALAACMPTQGGGACHAGFQCCSGYCDRGTCVDRGRPACTPIGGSCMQSSDCCTTPVVTCIRGICQTGNQ